MTHRMVATVSNFGGISSLKLGFTCDADRGSQCRMHCPEDCEEWGYGDHEHGLVDAGECMLVMCLDAVDDAFDNYDGPPAIMQPGEVTLTYEGDGCVSWEFARPSYAWPVYDR